MAKKKAPAGAIDSIGDVEKGRTIEAILKIQEGLSDAIVLLQARRMTPDVTSDERKLITVELADLEADSAKVQAKLLAFLGGQASFQPPSATEFEKIKELVVVLDEMTARTTTATGILRAATDLLTSFGGIAQT